MWFRNIDNSMDNNEPVDTDANIVDPTHSDNSDNEDMDIIVENSSNDALNTTNSKKRNRNNTSGRSTHSRYDFRPRKKQKTNLC